MAFRGRGRGHGGFGGGRIRDAKVSFELFPEIEELDTAAGVKVNLPLAIWYNKLQRYWNSFPYYVEDETGGSKETHRTEIEKYSDRNSQKTSSKQPLSHFIRMDPDYVPAELAKGEKKEQHGFNRVRWNPEADMQKLDVFEQLEQKHQGEEMGDKTDDEEEEENERLEEEAVYSDDGDYNQNIDFDDDDDGDEDDFNMGDDNDEKPTLPFPSHCHQITRKKTKLLHVKIGQFPVCHGGSFPAHRHSKVVWICCRLVLVGA